MKKIYLFLAALALLTLTLNAQLDATKKAVVRPTPQIEKVGIKMDAAFRNGPSRDGEVTPPYTCGFSDAELGSWSLIDNNSDESTWGVSEEQAVYGYNSSNAADDWLISPGVYLEAGKTYTFALDAKAQSANFPERLEVKMSSVVNSLPSGASIISATTLTNTTYNTLSNANVTVSTTGVYYFGIHAISNADMYNLWVDNVAITVNAETSDETICDGTGTNGYLPIYGLYNDEFQINQMIYPESLLSSLVGKDLTSMTFYATTNLGANLGTSKWTVKLGTTTQTDFASTLSSITRLVPSDVTTVAEGYSITTGINTMTITFTTPFTYNGGNLLVDFQSTTKGGYVSTSFYGANQSSYTGYNSNSSNATPGNNGHYSGGGVRQFLPKVTFTYDDSEPQHDLAIALSAPSTAGAGNTVDVTATVTNNGDFAENGYTVTVSDGTNIVNITAQEELGIGETATFTVQFATIVDAGGSTVNYTATVACTDDAVADNNSATASTALINLPPPENVAATPGENQTATMTWDAPTLTASPVTEGFEDTSMFPEFSLGGITATVHNGAIGNWTLYDATGSTVYGYQSITVPNLGNPMAWMVFAPGSSQISQSLMETQAPHNGNQMMASYCPDDATIASDHWLISPLLNGDAQTISFYARELTDQYGAETFEVLYSTTDNNPASFTLAESLSSSSTDWAQFTAQLPAGAKYFAIRHTSTDVFALFVDDITYIPEPAGPVSYNIYLDGQLVGNVPSTTFSYTFNNVSNGAHQCAVSAVYDLGESVAVPATFTMAQETTLAHLVSNGVVDGMYKISNDLVGGKVTWDDNRQMFAIFAKDNKAYANKRAPSEGQETYLINYQNGDFSNTVEQEDYDQSNWIEILIPSDLTGIASKSANPNAYTNKLRELQDEFEGLILPGGSIEGKYLDALNPSIEYYPTELPVAGSTSAYTPNIYTPANFLMENIDADGAKSYRDDELGNQYFFMMDAKPQEMALVVWCFYPGNGDYFYLPARVGDEVNGHQFHGNFKASMALCEDYNIDKNTTINSNVFEASDKDGTGINQVKLYGFNAVVRKNPAYWTPGNGAPRRADAVITPYTDGVEPTPAYIVYPLNAGATSTGTVTSVTERMATSIVVSTTYVNAQGLQSDKPFDGVNIVVTRYSDGSTRTTKVVKH